MPNERRPTSWLDPFVPPQLTQLGVPKPSEVMDAWLDATSAFVGLAEDAVGAGPDLLIELLGAVMGRYGSRQLSTAIHGVRVEGTLDSMTSRAPRLDDITVRLVDASVSGVPVSTLDVDATSVRLDTSSDPRLKAETITLAGTITLADIAAWMDTMTDDWNIRAVGQQIELVATTRSLRVVADVIVQGGAVTFEVRSLRWRGLRLRLPRFLRHSRRVEIPLPDRMRLHGAYVFDDDGVATARVVVEVTDVDQQIDVAALRAAISSGSVLTVQ